MLTQQLRRPGPVTWKLDRRRTLKLLPGHWAPHPRSTFSLQANDNGPGSSNQNSAPKLPGSSRLETQVPSDQRPINELSELKKTWLCSWGTLELGDYIKRLTIMFIVFFSLVGGPISYQTFDPSQQPAEFMLSATTGSLLVVAAVVIRIYLGWQYVGDRLMSAAVEYEETGWYDGQVYVKPPEILTRDRLLGLYEVKPVLAKLKTTLVGSAGMLAGTATVLALLIHTGADTDGVYGRGASRVPRIVSANGVLYSSKVHDLSELRADDTAAAEEAAAQGGIPGYCGDRLFKAYAGGQYCGKFER